MHARIPIILCTKKKMHTSICPLLLLLRLLLLLLQGWRSFGGGGVELMEKKYRKKQDAFITKNYIMQIFIYRLPIIRTDRFAANAG